MNSLVSIRLYLQENSTFLLHRILYQIIGFFWYYEYYWYS